MVHKQQFVGHKPYHPSTRLPNEIEQSIHMPGRVSNDALHHNGVAKQRDITSETLKLQKLIADPANVRVLRVEEATRYSSSQVLLKLVKDHDLELERIDQELLELGPFAKDTYIPENSHTRQEVCPPMPQYTHATPTEPKRRKSRMSTNLGPSPRQGAASRRVSHGPGEHSVASPSGLSKQAQEDKESVKEPPKRKWRKVGSAGSNSSRNSSSDGQATKASSATTPVSIDTKTIIPAASEKEMLSLYLPSEFEVASSSPTERGSIDTSSESSAGASEKTNSLSSGEQQAVRNEGTRTFTTEHFHPVQTVSSSTPSSLTTAVARHSPTQPPHPHSKQSSQNELIIVDDFPTTSQKPTDSYSRLEMTSGSGDSGTRYHPHSHMLVPSDLSRHVVVSGGIPLSRTNSYTTSSRGSPRPRGDESLRGPVTPSGHSRLVRNERSSASPQLSHAFMPPPHSLDKRRNSSASSFASSHDSLPASFKQPPGGTRSNNEHVEKMQQQLKMSAPPQVTDPKVGGMNPYIMYSKPPDGAPVMHGLYPSPFFPTMPAGMMVPSFGNMLIDPATGVFKQPMYGPLVQYRYPFPGAPNLKPFQNPTLPPGTSHPGTPTVTVGIPQQSLYTFPPSPGMSAFKNVQESRSNAATPPFVRVGSSPLTLSRDDSRQANNEDRQPGINWNPGLISTNLGMIPFPMNIGGQPTSLSQPTSMMNLFNNVLPAQGLANTIGTNSEGNIPKLAGIDPQWMVQHRQGAMNSIDGSGSSHSHHQATTLPMSKVSSSGAPLQIPQHIFVPTDVSKWKDKTGNSPPLNMGVPYPPMVGGLQHKPDSTHYMTDPQQRGSRGGTPNTRRRGEGKSSPKVPAERLKLRIHQVKDDDFKNAGKVDGRKRRGKAKDRVVAIISQPLHPEEAPPVPKQTTLKKAEVEVKSQETVQANVPTTGGQDDNYGLNILAAMSSMQKRDGAIPTSNILTAPHTTLSKPPLTVNTSNATITPPSPVSLAGAQSLLLLGNDVPSPEKEKTQQEANDQPSNMESSIVDSLLKLSGSVPTSTNRGKSTEQVDAFVVQGRDTRSASFSAAEAMLLMVGAENENEASSKNGKKTPIEEVFETSPRNNDDEDSEATDTDSEATLTPGSPTLKVPRKQVVFCGAHSPLAQQSDDEMAMAEEQDQQQEFEEASATDVLQDCSQDSKDVASPSRPISETVTEVPGPEHNNMTSITTKTDKIDSYPELNTPPPSSPIQPVSEEEQSQSETVTEPNTLLETKPGILDSPDSLENAPLPDKKIASNRNGQETTLVDRYPDKKDSQFLYPTFNPDNVITNTHTPYSVHEDVAQEDTVLLEINQPSMFSGDEQDKNFESEKFILEANPPEPNTLPETKPVSPPSKETASHGNRLPSWGAFTDETVCTAPTTSDTKHTEVPDDVTDALDADLISVSASLEEVDDLLGDKVEEEEKR